jgi:hypothetical protein
MGVEVSELIGRMDRAIAECPDGIGRSELLARKACYLARVGAFVDAQAIVAALRRHMGVPGYERIGIWVILCEGILDFYSNITDQARDRVMRAQKLSLAFNDPILIPIASAWRAFMEFEWSNFTQMSEATRLTLDFASEDDHDSRARIATTLGYAFILAGDLIASKRWFDIAHHHAVAAGDRATIEALMYNRASFGLSNLRVQSCFGLIADADVSRNRLELQSAANFHQLIRFESFRQLIDLCNARSLTLAGSYAEAAECLARLSQGGPFAKSNFSDDLISIEIAYCLWKSGQSGEALHRFSKVIDRDLSHIDPDDRLIGSKMILELAREDYRFESPAIAEDRFIRFQAEYLCFRERIRSAISPFAQP